MGQHPPQGLVHSHVRGRDDAHREPIGLREDPPVVTTRSFGCRLRHHVATRRTAGLVTLHNLARLKLVRRQRLRLFPEYGAGPLWSRAGPLDLDRIRFSDELVRRLRAWEEEAPW